MFYDYFLRRWEFFYTRMFKVENTVKENNFEILLATTTT